MGRCFRKTKDNKMVDAERDAMYGSAQFRARDAVHEKRNGEGSAGSSRHHVGDHLPPRILLPYAGRLDTEGQFTATMYMRPNAVWALEL
jgi:hypothetical protein